jgi:hypothetical protein
MVYDLLYADNLEHLVLRIAIWNGLKVIRAASAVQ